MAQATLVEMQIKNGQCLIDRLAREGIAISAAGWVKESESGDWYLYVATPLVGEDRVTGPAYRRIHTVMRSSHEEDIWMDPLEIKLLAPHDPIARAMTYRDGRPRGVPTRLGPARLGELVIDEAYIYPPTGNLEAAAEKAGGKSHGRLHNGNAGN